MSNYISFVDQKVILRQRFQDLEGVVLSLVEVGLGGGGGDKGYKFRGS